MEPFQARIAFLSFIVLSGVIVVNAIYLQQGRHGVPVTSVDTGGQPAETGGKKTGKIPPPRQFDRAPLHTQSFSETSPRLVRAVQRELKLRGYDPGTVNGNPGVLTYGAILAYEVDQKIPLTGRADNKLLQHILLGAVPVLPGRSVQKAPSARAGALIRAVQKILAEQGYAPGKIDGKLSESTRLAISEFERDRELPVSGRISGKLVREIMRITGVKIKLKR